MKPRWIYLTDMSSHGSKIMNLETGECRKITLANVKERAPIGLRRYVLESGANGMFAETGEFVPATQELIDELEDAYHAINSWNYDWPHFHIEVGEEATLRTELSERLTAMMAAHPYDFEVTGLQRRFLLYFSDGNHDTQARFDGMIPHPAAVPYRRDGTLRRAFRGDWNNHMRDARVAFPAELEREYGKLRPLLYRGPAWVVRFKLDNQVPAFEHTRVYVRDDGSFICSDWCQRADFSSYSKGINLQEGHYTFDSWITTSCVQRASAQGSFSPKRSKFESVAVRELLKSKSAVVIPTFDEALTDAKAKVAAEAPDPLRTQIGTLLEQKPELHDEQIADAIVRKVLADWKAAKAQLLGGVPLFLRKTNIPEDQQPLVADAQVTETTVRLRAGLPSACKDKNVQASQICLMHGKYHAHFYPTQVAIDIPTLRQELVERIGSERIRRRPQIELPPLSADVISEADRLLEEQVQERAAALRAKRLSEALDFAMGLTPIEHRVGSTGQHGLARFTPNGDGTVTLAWLDGKYANPDQIYRYKPTEELDGVMQYQRRSEYLPEDAWAPVTPRSAPWWAMEWFRKEREGKDYVQFAKAYDDEFTFDETVWRVRHLGGGKVHLRRVVYGETSTDGRIIQRGGNGHVYIVKEDGTTAAIPQGIFRDAAFHYFKNVAQSVAKVLQVA